MVDKEELNKLVYEVQMGEYQAKHLQDTISQMEGALQELFITKDSISNLKKNKETLVPLGVGVFAKAEIKDDTTVISSIGLGTFAEQDTKSVIEKIEKEIELYSKELEKRAAEFTKLIEKLQELNKKVKKLSEEKKDVRPS